MSRINDPMSETSGTSGAQQELHEGEGRIKEAAQQVSQAASEYYERGYEKAQQWNHQLQEYVQEQPIKSLLIAAGVGVLLGVIWKRS